MSVDPHTDHQAAARRLDVNYRSHEIRQRFEQAVHRAHDRRAAREVAQAVDVVFAGRQMFGFAGRLRRITAEPLVERRRNILKRGDRYREVVAQNDPGGMDRGRVGGIGDGEPVSPAGRLVGKDGHLAQETTRGTCRPALGRRATPAIQAPQTAITTPPRRRNPPLKGRSLPTRRANFAPAVTPAGVSPLSTRRPCAGDGTRNRSRSGGASGVPKRCRRING